MKQNLKITKLLVNTALILVAVISYSCGDDLRESKAQKASKEACECLKGHSMQYCEDELNKKYVITDSFIEEFNKENKCGIVLYRKN
jgi:delta-aminolevulinic acid dehydratase/porphobilinogen synthase